MDERQKEREQDKKLQKALRRALDIDYWNNKPTKLEIESLQAKMPKEGE